MPRRSIDDVEDLTPFFHWLVHQQDRSPGTAKVYVSGVRQVLRELGDRVVVADSVQSYFNDLRETKPSAYSSRLSSYNAWRSYKTKVLGETDVPVVKTSKGTPKGAELPLEVCGALRTLRDESSISFRTLALMTWEDVEILAGARGDYYHVRDPTQKGVSFKADADAIDAIMKWSNPASLYLPLVPREPGSDQTYGAKGMRREAGKGQETLLDRVARLRKEERGQVDVSDTPTITAANYHSDYLPKVDEADTVEGLLGVGRTRKADAGRVAPAPFSPESNDLPRPKGASNGRGLHSAPSTPNSRPDSQPGYYWNEKGEHRPISERDEATKPRVRYPLPKGQKTSPDRHSAERTHWADPTTWPSTSPCPTCVQGFENPIGHDGKHCDDCAEAQNSVNPLEAAAAILGVDVGKLEALVTLLKEVPPVRPEPEPEMKAGILNLAELRNRLTTEEAEVPEPIKEKPPIVGGDGQLYDPNDPDYSEEDA